MINSNTIPKQSLQDEGKDLIREKKFFGMVGKRAHVEIRKIEIDAVSCMFKLYKGNHWNVIKRIQGVDHTKDAILAQCLEGQFFPRKNLKNKKLKKKKFNVSSRFMTPQTPRKRSLEFSFHPKINSNFGEVKSRFLNFDLRNPWLHRDSLNVLQEK